MANRKTAVTARITPPRVHWSLALTSLAVLAFLLRCATLLELRHSPVLAVLIGDGAQYVAWARDIAAGHWLGSQVFYQSPLYPYLLAMFFKAVGVHLFGVRLLQAVFGSLSCVLLAHAGRHFFNERVGLLAGALLAIYPPSIFFDAVIQKASLDLLLVTGFIAALAEFSRSERWGWIAAAGASLGVFALNRENARVILPVVLLWLFMAFRHVTVGRRTVWATVFTASMAALVIPVATRNYVVGGEFLISTSQLGPNLFIGNHAGATGVYEALVPGHGNASYEQADATLLAEAAAGRTLSPGEVSRYWTARALDFIRAEPGAWIRLMLRKVVLTFGGAEITDTESLRAYLEYSFVLTTLRWFTFGLVLPLGVFGLWTTQESWRTVWVLPAIAVIFGLAVSLFFVVARYRYPIVPIVMLFAAVALLKLSKWRTVAVPRTGVIAGLATALIVNFPVDVGSDDTFLNIGAELVRERRPADAIPVLQKAVAAAPADALLHFNYGVALNAISRKDEAAGEFSRAVALRPNDFEFRTALALTLRETGHVSEALTHFSTAAELNPNSPGAHVNLGASYGESGNLAAAVAEFETAVRLAPHDGAIHGHLGMALAAIGRDDDALAEFASAVRLTPDAVDVSVNYADLLLAAGRAADAIAEYQRAVRLAPDRADLEYRLGQAYGQRGSLPDALAALNRALALANAQGQVDVAARIEAVIRGFQASIK